MKTLVELFNFGMMRNYHDIIPDKESGLILNLGPGNKTIPKTITLEYPEWDAEVDDIGFIDNSVEQIHAYHFLEHIRNVPHVIAECERVLKPGGHMNIVVPYYNSQLQAQDLDHKTPFTEHTFRTLFCTDYYSKNKVKPMRIATNFIMGDCEKNLCLIVQLVKI